MIKKIKERIRPYTKKSTLIKLFAAFLLLVGLPLGILVSQEEQDIRQKASTEMATGEATHNDFVVVRDTEEEQEFEFQAVEEFYVQPIYFTPSDVNAPLTASERERLDLEMLNAVNWYQGKVGKTFRLKPIISIQDPSNPASFYRSGTPAPSDDIFYRVANNFPSQSENLQTGPRRINAFFLYTGGAERGGKGGWSPQTTRGATIWTDCTIKSILNRPLNGCPNLSDASNKGIIYHELGHAFGLNHTGPGTPTPALSFMTPSNDNLDMLQEQKTHLSNSPYFNQGSNPPGEPPPDNPPDNPPPGGNPTGQAPGSSCSIFGDHTCSSQNASDLLQCDGSAWKVLATCSDGGTCSENNKIVTCTLPGDTTKNATVDIHDFNVIFECFGDKQCANKGSADVDTDGDVDGVDYNIFVRNFGKKSEAIPAGSSQNPTTTTTSGTTGTSSGSGTATRNPITICHQVCDNNSPLTGRNCRQVCETR